MKKNKLIIAIIASALIFFVIGFYSGRTLTINYFESQLQELEERWEKAKEYYGMEELEMYNISGTVTRIDNNVIFVDTGFSTNPFIDWIQEREVVVTENTTIIFRERKDWEQMEKEWEEYMKIEQEFFEILDRDPEIEMDLEHPEPPSEFKVIGEISVNEIRQGMEIRVEAGRDIADEKRFEAIEIFVTELGTEEIE